MVTWLAKSLETPMNADGAPINADKKREKVMPCIAATLSLEHISRLIGVHLRWIGVNRRSPIWGY
jgi:hypothetical protein